MCVATGEHVPGTPVEINDWNEDVLEHLLEANDQLPKSSRSEDREDISIDRDDYDLEDYDPEVTRSDETTTDIRDVFAAIDRLDAERVADKTIVQRWNDEATTSDGERAFWPTWGSVSSDSGTANIVNDKRWQDTGELGGYGGPVTMAAIDAGEIRPANARPVDGETWWRGVEHLRKLGFDIPKYEVPKEDRERDEDFPPLLEAALDIEEGKESYCTGCGTMSPNRSPPPRSVNRVRDVAVQLSVTLHEFGIAHDWVHLVERVQELKRKSELAGNDFECFRRGTAEAIERAAPE